MVGNRSRVLSLAGFGHGPELAIPRHRWTRACSTVVSDILCSFLCRDSFELLGDHVQALASDGQLGHQLWMSSRTLSRVCRTPGSPSGLIADPTSAPRSARSHTIAEC